MLCPTWSKEVIHCLHLMIVKHHINSNLNPNIIIVTWCPSNKWSSTSEEFIWSLSAIMEMIKWCLLSIANLFASLSSFIFCWIKANISIPLSDNHKYLYMIKIMAMICNYYDNSKPSLTQASSAAKPGYMCYKTVHWTNFHSNNMSGIQWSLWENEAP